MTSLEEMATLIERHASEDSGQATAIPGLFLLRATAPSEPVHALYAPAVCFAAQGRKRVMLADEAYCYDAAHFLLGAVDLPVVGQVVGATPDAPYLSVRLDIDAAEVGALVAEMDTLALPSVPPSAAIGRGLSVGRVDVPLRDAVTRLLRLLDRPAHIPLLAPLVTREILVLLLTGECGGDLRRITLGGGPMAGVVEALRHLNADFASPLRVNALAREAHMSVSVFHRHFKAVTALSPLQYQKRLRLQEARRLLLGEEADAATAALQVGYESASQFSREYRRLFGEPPRRDATRLRKTLPAGS